MKINLRNFFTGQNFKLLAADLIYDAIGSILFAAGIYTFASGASFAPGGISGIALIINHYVPFLRIGLCTLILNIPVIAVCFRILGKKFFFKSVKSMIISALFMDLIFPLFPVYSGDPLLASLFAGALSGAGLALIYMRNSSTGGTDFIIMSLKKKLPHMSIGTISFVVDGAVIVAGGFVFGNINAVLYGVLMTIVSTTVIDKLMYGSGSQRMLLVISDKSEEIADRISEDTERGATLMRATGAYTGKERMIMLCVCSKTEVFKARSAAHKIDPDAMVMICTVDEAYGLGFNRPEPS
ncbi:MAG: YitT family protein [Clostridia bacterium]|nr:YitT family protein [Clostridia bacterium]